jgi:hypothetical protein
MPQSTNLNKSPYFDDFNEDKNYYKVLFKPGVTVQTRELTTLQSILQNQIEKFGNSFYSNGGVVIPGGFKYENNFNAVEVESQYNGIDVETYFDNLVGKTIQGKITGIKATVVKVLSKLDSEKENTTLYVNYTNSAQSSSSETFVKEVFDNGEELVVLENIAVGSSYIFSGSSFAKTISLSNRNCTSVGSAAKLDEGVYFVRGYFANVYSNTIILDQYTNTPSYRVGLEIVEEIIDSNEDSSLNDNAQGFSNYSAPGADRFKIQLGLIKKSLDDFNDNNFIELFRVDNGNLNLIKKDDRYSFINEILARRTFDESGNYYVDPFNVEALESLNDRLGNGGLYLDGQKTLEGNTVSKDLGAIKISPGKAYVKGYEVPSSTVVVDYPKPRTTKEIQSSSASFYAGDLLRVNNISNVPNIGLSTSYVVSLLNKRLTDNAIGSASTIGLARVYNFESYNTSYVDPSSQFNLYLFDIQTYTTLTLSSSISELLVGDYVKGANSGAFGYIKSINGTTIDLYQVSGSFSVGESILLNGISKTQTLLTVSDYSIDDVKSVYNSSGFNADTLLSKQTTLTGPFTFKVDAGIATVTSDNGSSFASNIKVNDVIKFSRSGINSSIYVGVTSIYSTKNKVEIVGLSTVQNVCAGDIGISTSYSINQLSLIKPQIVANPNNDSSLYSPLSNENVADVSTVNSNIYVKKLQSINRGVSPTTTLSLTTLVGDYVYASYDAERYVIVNEDGSKENLSNASFATSNGGKNATFTGLSSKAGISTVITTQIKSNVTSKFKKLNRCTVVTRNKTKYSSPATNSGLGYTSIYGIRVEDQEISLNRADIVELHGVFQSSTSDAPILPWVTLTGIFPDSNLDNLVSGELIIGQESGAVAIYVEKKSSSQINLVYKNDIAFTSSEIVDFKESGYSATISEVGVGDKNIINDFTLDDGQRKQFYDYGRLVRKNNSKEPSNKLKIVFDYFNYESTDNGDVITVNSYPSTLNKNKIHSYNNVRNTDTLDLRPRVSTYSNSSGISPFEFGSRNFESSENAPVQILAPNEDFIFDYSFYLGRTDKLTLSKDGSFNLVLGNPSQSPAIPAISSEVLDVATIEGLPYVYDIKDDINIILTDNKRYTMSDLRKIETRVSDLEYYTSLNLLEVSTKNLLVEDENGLNKFKSGFFVDNFSSYDFSNTNDPEYRANISNNTLNPQKVKNRIDLTLYSDDSQISPSNVVLSNTNCSNLKLTGHSLTLNYSEINHVQQPFASRITNINPYNVTTWGGVLTLNPSSDTWVVDVSKSEQRWGHHSTVVKVETTTTPYIRSRNIEFIATRLKPNSRFKLLFDSKDLTSTIQGNTYTFPKLLQINNVSGSFTIGESVKIYSSDSSQILGQFRTCTPNHKSGEYNNPSSVYSTNPYNPTVGIATLYGPQSTILNVDTSSLQVSNISNFYGNIAVGYILVGTTSGARATVSGIELITDDNGTLIGSIFIPDPNTSSIKYNTGSTSAKVTQYTSLGTPGENVSFAESIFTSSGTTKTTTTIRWADPIAQTFLVDDTNCPNGIFPASVDVYFKSKSSTLPVSLEIREVVNGLPGGPDKVIESLQKTLLPVGVNTSADGTIATTFTFDNLKRLESGREYAIVLISDSNDYNVWISRIGEVEITTANKSEVEKIIINKQPSLGSLFKSQNATTWDPIQTDDLKFTLKKCKFITNGGTAKFYNSKVSVKSPENLLPENPIKVTRGSSSPNDGYYMQINHPNHGMNFSGNKVTIDGVMSDTLPQKITAGYGLTATGAINVDSATIFSTFANVAVDGDNPGYIIMNEEIMQYTGVVGNTLTGITRQYDSTSKVNHQINSLIYKYEFNGVSLRNINRSHFVSNVGEITLDSYYIPLPGGLDPFTDTKFGGGSSVYVTKNKVFNTIEIPSEFVSVSKETITNASIRTISATSIDGIEPSFVDQGYSALDLSNPTKYNTLRMVASEENESEYLNATQFTGNKSLSLDLTLDTNDTNVSPIINLNQLFLTTNGYRINQPIDPSNYSSDNRINSTTDDPNAFIHISNKIELLKSASSLKVILDANRTNGDIVALYKIFRNDSPDEDQVWQLFPGYDNLNTNMSIKNIANNSGKPDTNVPINKGSEYFEYTFTMNNIPDFTAFAIKLICSSTNQASSPLIKNLRTIALQ